MIPDHFVVVRGGTKPLPPPGQVFSCAAGPDKFEAAKGIPHGNMRSTTAGEIRRLDGVVESAPEMTAGGTLNVRHVNVMEGKSGAFGEVEPNPVLKQQRIR
jgi:hypothetical protein